LSSELKFNEKFPEADDSPLKTWSDSERDNLEQAIDDVINQAREELGEAWLVEIGDTATVKCLLTELEIEERLDALINASNDCCS
jgi:hypothetical protein